MELTPSNHKEYTMNTCQSCYNELRRKSQREYQKKYLRRPEARKRYLAYQKRYMQTSTIPVADVFDKDKPLTFKEIHERAGGGRGYILERLKEYVNIGVVEKLADGRYRINPKSALRMAMDGYFESATKATTG